MAYIYKITNQINGKVYIGATIRNPETRWAEHQRDYIRLDFEKRPLYNAINKYGVNNFTFETIEETNEPQEREIYYIQKYDSFNNGYNATLGGEGTRFIDEGKVVNLYLENQQKTISIIAKELEISTDAVSDILKRNHIDIRASAHYHSKPIYQLDKQTEEIIQEFSCVNDAARFLGDKRKSQHISEVCKGIRKSAYGFKWKYKVN